MDETTDNPTPDQGPPGPPPRRLPGRRRSPSLRLTTVLAVAMLAVGVGVGAAIGPAPDASYAGGAAAIAQRLPLLLAGIAGREHSATSSTSTSAAPPPVTSQPTPAPASTGAATPASSTQQAASTPTKASSEAEEGTASKPKSPETKKSKLPPVTNVWLIELAGGSFSEALATPSAAPYITGQLIPASTLLGGWPAISASAFASEAALAEEPAAGAAPPLVHSIVQPPCPEGAAGAACATGTPGQLSAADEFLKATIATITGTPIYKEHGLIVVTFATVGISTQSGLPTGASSATLTDKPPSGVALLSPFAHTGTRSNVAFNPTSPRQSLEKLLH
jgi:hypothetical protein